MARATLLFLLAIPFVATAQPKQPEKKKDVPKVLYAVPLVTSPGEKQKLILRGKHLDAVKDVTTSEGAVKVLAGRKAAPPNNYPVDRIGDTEVELELTLPKNAKPGVTLTVAGAEPFKLLIPDALPVVVEKEPNDGYEAAQPIAPPCAVVGTIHQEKNPDVFRVAGKAGQKLRAEVQAAQFGSPLDGILTLVDENRRFVAANDDTNNNRDPAVSVVLPRDGVYYLSLIDAHDLGGAGFGYRLVVRLE